MVAFNFMGGINGVLRNYSNYGDALAPDTGTGKNGGFLRVCGLSGPRCPPVQPNSIE